MGLSLRVGCGNCREKGSERRAWMLPVGREADADRLKSSLSHYKGSWGGYSPVSVLLGRYWLCDQRPLLIRVNHSLDNQWRPVLSCFTLPMLSASFTAPCSEQASGRGPTGALALPAQRLALQEDSHLTPGGDNQFFSVWEKPRQEAILPKMRGKQPWQRVRTKDSPWRKVIIVAQMKRKLENIYLSITTCQM